MRNGPLRVVHPCTAVQQPTTLLPGVVFGEGAGFFEMLVGIARGEHDLEPGIDLARSARELHPGHAARKPDVGQQ